jgi:hypothetical protein
MSKLREAAQKAVDTFESDYDSMYQAFLALKETIKGLRAVLAEPERTQEPVAWTRKSELTKIKTLPAGYAGAMWLRKTQFVEGGEPADVPLYDHPAPEQKQEPTQEPVAWMESPHGAIRANPIYRFTAGTQTLKWALPLYLHPAPPQTPMRRTTKTPMTDEQIIEAAKYAYLHSDDSKGEWLIIARAVERYHGIGDK